MSVLPLHAEIFEILKSYNAKKIVYKMPDDIMSRITITRHSSRVRKAMEEMAKNGVLFESDHGFTIARASKAA